MDSKQAKAIQRRKRQEAIAAGVLIFAIILIACLGWQDAQEMIPGVDSRIQSDIERRGQIGDSYGGLTALFTALAFFGVILTAHLQTKELQLQRDELTATREVMRQQAGSISKQTFEATLFQMLRIQNEMRGDLMFEESNLLKRQGREAFEGYVQLVSKEFDYHRGQNPNEDGDLPSIKLAYAHMYRRYEHCLGPFFRNLYHMFKLIDISSLKEEEKPVYANLARAQMSDDESLLLFYNGLSEFGDGLKRLSEQYGLLKHVPDNGVFQAHHRTYYERSAFLDVQGRLDEASRKH